MRNNKTDKICRGVVKLYLTKAARPIKDAQQLALNFSAKYARYCYNVDANTLTQIITGGNLLNNSPYGLAALTTMQIRVLFAILALMYEQTTKGDILTITEQPRGAATMFAFNLADIRKKALLGAERLPEMCQTILGLENKIFISGDGKGSDKYFVNDFLLKIDTIKTLDMPRKEYNALTDADRLAKLKAAGQITMQINKIAYNKLQIDFTPIKREVFENLKKPAARKQIVCKTYVLFLFLSGLSDAYKIKFTAVNSDTGKRSVYYDENRLTIEHYWDIAAATEFYDRHRKQRAADTITALNFCKTAGLLTSYRITEDGFIYFRLNPKLKPKDPKKITDYQTKKKATRAAAKLAAAV